MFKSFLILQVTVREHFYQEQTQKHVGCGMGPHVIQPALAHPVDAQLRSEEFAGQVSSLGSLSSSSGHFSINLWGFSHIYNAPYCVNVTNKTLETYFTDRTTHLKMTAIQ